MLVIDGFVWNKITSFLQDSSNVNSSGFWPEQANAKVRNVSSSFVSIDKEEIQRKNKVV